MAHILKPLEDRVIVRPLDEDNSDLELPNHVKEKPQEGEVVALGPGRVDEHGHRVPLDVALGDKIIYSKYGGTEVKYAGHDFLILSVRDLLAVVSSAPAATTSIGATAADEISEAVEFLKSRDDVRAAISQDARQALVNVLLAGDVELVEPASLHQARRQAAMTARLLSTPVLTHETLCELRNDPSENATRTWISRARKDGRLFTVSHHGRTLIPAAQFDEEGRIRKPVSELIRPLHRAGMGGWQIWAWLVSPTPLLSGLVPIDAISQSDTAERALRAAERAAARLNRPPQSA